MEVEDDDEEEDLDFNPLSKGESHSEASSGLSSDNDGPDNDNVICGSSHRDAASPSKKTSRIHSHSNLDSGNEDDEIVMQGRLGMEISHGKDYCPGGSEKKEHQEEIISCREDCDNEDPSMGDATCSLAKESLGVDGSSSIPKSFSEPVVEENVEDAICTRTRARHSLANHTLEELEAFLQESEDDDDLKNVDDEEEYHKFLAAVLLGEPNDGQSQLEGENLDEDEENDADFVVELEEALESDIDENADNDGEPEDKHDDNVHRPETRQKKRLKESNESKSNLLQQTKLPLRPIIPYVSNSHLGVASPYGLQLPYAKGFSQSPSSLWGIDLATGFTVQQLGQLYCLIHEHIQLLIQVYSVCILDPSRQEIAMEVQKMIKEMVVRHEESLAWRKIPYDMSCFHPSNLSSTLQSDSHQSSDHPAWTPSIHDPTFSILDVAPLRLAKNYISDVSATVLQHRQTHLEYSAEKRCLKKEPLFPSPAVASQKNVDESSLVVNPMSVKLTSPVSTDQLQTKKSLAATLVESTKKQSVALVPTDIANLAQRFYPLFNLDLFPHKPPLPSIANRVLFTDAEDGLLAMGLMQYNNDWSAIQKHLLPCKSKHQIFVRQKNRSSSKAPENPIKDVRRMKTSPLTSDEKARIYEGLKVFRHDWLSIWKYFVPHRDPSLLPRQWRIANGIQKSYSKTESVKEKRRIYEAKRRKLKSSKEAKNGGDNSGEEMDNENEAYVHEAFLADSDPRSSINISNGLLYNGSYASGECVSVTNELCHPYQDGTFQDHPSLNSQQHENPLSRFSDIRYSNPSFPFSNSNSLGARADASVFLKHKREGARRLVKLAPGLPPVNLPPSVHIIPQSAFKNQLPGSCQSYIGKGATKNLASISHGVTKLVNCKRLSRPEDTVIHDRCQQDANQCVSEENGSESDLQMHPLLFQAPENQFSSNYSMNNCSTASTTYNFLPHTRLQTNLELLRAREMHSKDSTNMSSDLRRAASDLYTIEFHPLLQRMDDANCVSDNVAPVNLASGGLIMENGCDEISNQPDCVPKHPLPDNSNLVVNGPLSYHHGRQNKVDLDIRLNSVSGKEKIIAERDPSNNQIVEACSSTVEQSMIEKTNSDMTVNVRNVPLSHSVNHQRAYYENDFNSSVSTQLYPKRLSESANDSYDESMQGIVMEHEELSDSEEDSENVEFECEEMEDSEADELDGACFSQFQDKEIPNPLAGKIEAIHHVNQLQSVLQGSADEVRDSPLPQRRQASGQTTATQSRSKRRSVNKEKPSSSSQSALPSYPGQAIKTQKPRNSRGRQQSHLPTGGESRNVASRKPRKSPLCK